MQQHPGPRAEQTRGVVMARPVGMTAPPRPIKNVVTFCGSLRSLCRNCKRAHRFGRNHAVGRVSGAPAPARNVLAARSTAESGRGRDPCLQSLGTALARDNQGLQAVSTRSVNRGAGGWPSALPASHRVVASGHKARRGAAIAAAAEAPAAAAGKSRCLADRRHHERTQGIVHSGDSTWRACPGHHLRPRPSRKPQKTGPRSAAKEKQHV